MAEYEYNDFGFTAVDSDELVHIDKKITSSDTVYEKDVAITKLSKKVDSLESFIRPLLENLAKDSDKEYIYWPNRLDMVTRQMKKLDDIIES
jgi:hypothetical protein